MNSVPLCIFGGTGVFGQIIVHELSQSPVPFRITVCARDEGRFQKAFPLRSESLSFRAVDLRDLPSVSAALEGQKIMILAAGPFQKLSPEIGGIAARQGAHYLDIGDWPPYYFGLKEASPQFQEAGLVCIPGLSSLPGISVPLFLLLQEEFDRVEEIRIGLFIGNRNRKGLGAMASALRSEALPPFDFPFPEPIGPFPAFPLCTPEEKILPMISPGADLHVGASFEWGAARRAFALLRRFFRGGKGSRLDPFLSFFLPAINRLSRGGTERGCVSVTARGQKAGEGRFFRASLFASSQSQRIAALPCVIAAEALARGELQAKGWLLPQQWLEPQVLIRCLVEKGLEYGRERL